MSQSQDPIDVEFDTQTAQYQDHRGYHTDADSIRRAFGIPPYERDRFEEYKRNVFPNLVEHVWDGPPQGATRDKGGTDILATGKPGSGKSSWARYLSARVMEINDEKVVWRGSTARSEWLPFAPWTRLCLPAGVDIKAFLDPRVPTDPPHEDIDLSNLVREVVYYDDVRHLNRDLLKPGQFHVVYPDPRMRGLQDVYRAADEKQYETPGPKERERFFHPEDPSKHWWFGWVLDRIERGPHHFTTLILDEIGDIAPQSASKDAYGTFQKVELLKDCYVDARKKGLTIFAFGHAEVDIHQLIRHKIRWRTAMAGSANPTTKSDVVGFDRVPMDAEFSSSMDPGDLLVYNEQNFDDLTYADTPGSKSLPPSVQNYKLKLSLGGSR